MAAQKQATLFQTESMSLGEIAEMVERQLLTKTQRCHVSFGIFKNKKGFVDHNAMVVFTNNHGHHFTFSVNAENFRDLFSQVNEQLSQHCK
jgi:hypothetical protein